MNSPIDGPPPDLPYFHYMTERNRIHRYSATKRTTVLASLPERCPYRARFSPKNAKKLELGWLEFHSPEPPDPDVARPGDVWIQIPSDFESTAGAPDTSDCRLFVCYSAEGRQWTEWEGDERVHTNDPPVGIHPLVSPAMWDGSTKRDAQFYLAFTGSEFTWVSGMRLATIASQWRLGRIPGDWMKRLIAKHSIDGIPFLAPADAIAAWAERKTFTASGVRKKKDKKRPSNEPTPELPSTKRRKPESETSTPGIAHGWHPVPAPPHLEPGTISYPYSFVSWSHVSHWTVMQPPFPPPSRQSTPPSSGTSDESMHSPTTPPSPTFVLRPATFTLPVSPANESQLSDDPPPTPPSPVPQLQLPSTDSRPPPTMYPHVSFTPTLSPPRYGERTRRPVLRSSTLPTPTRYAQSAEAGPSAPALSSTSASPLSTADPSTFAPPISVSVPPITEGRRAPAGAIDAPPRVRGKYAKAGAIQHGWSLYVGETELLMPFPCDKCKRAGAICSGLEGERCGRCRAIRKPCSHNTQPRPSTAKSDPPGETVMVPVSFPAVNGGPVALSAKDKRDEAPSRRTTGGSPVDERMKLGSGPGSALRTSVVSRAIVPLQPSGAQDESSTESQDEDENAVEELMNTNGGEEDNVGIGTVSEIAQEDSEEVATVGHGEPAIAPISQAAIPVPSSTLQDNSTLPQGNARADDSIACVGGATDVDLSVGVPGITTKALDCQGARKETRWESVEDLEGSSTLLNKRATVHLEGLCHVGPLDRWNPASQAIIDGSSEPQMTLNPGDVVEGPLADPAGDPAPDCSQEVCTRAADGAAAGGGSRSTTPAADPGVSQVVGPRGGCRQSGATSLPAPLDESMRMCPPQVVSEGPSPAEQMAVDDEIVRFMEITLNGMSQVQDGLRGVFAIQKRRRAVQKRKTVEGDK
ncbi:hypothetical protein BC826DRAFT_75499 [Russula brevipes]|nr:hypothetical protein BC826DRAFT_75499 [Russula brevipes]